MDEQLKKFLALVPTANWRQPPNVWNQQLREALSEGFITVGFGGVLKLTDAGREAAKLDPRSPNVSP
jgi:hypothetical protein